VRGERPVGDQKVPGVGKVLDLVPLGLDLKDVDLRREAQRELESVDLSLTVEKSGKIADAIQYEERFLDEKRAV
jgi:hypothetical protein